eukprot:3936787-Lingulodinium_polyedra.AAC.1
MPSNRPHNATMACKSHARALHARATTGAPARGVSHGRAVCKPLRTTHGRFDRVNARSKNATQWR